MPQSRSEGAVMQDHEAPLRDEELCRRILTAIANHTACTGRPPSYREVPASLGLASHRRLSECLDDLVRVGQLRRLPGARNLILPPS